MRYTIYIFVDHSEHSMLTVLVICAQTYIECHSAVFVC